MVVTSGKASSLNFKKTELKGDSRRCRSSNVPQTYYSEMRRFADDQKYFGFQIGGGSMLFDESTRADHSQIVVCLESKRVQPCLDVNLLVKAVSKILGRRVYKNNQTFATILNTVLMIGTHSTRWSSWAIIPDNSEPTMIHYPQF